MSQISTTPSTEYDPEAHVVQGNPAAGGNTRPLKFTAAGLWAWLRSAAFGTTATTACVGNDSRLSDSRDPTAHEHPQSDVTGLTAALAAKADLVAGKIPAGQLPSYVDDVLEVADATALPDAGESGKIWITLDTGHSWRWTGSAWLDLDATSDQRTTDLEADILLKASSTALATEASVRLAADLNQGNSRSLVRGRIYTGGYSYFPASTARAGWLNYGAATMHRVLAAGTGTGTLAEMGPLKIECADPDTEVDNTRLQVSLTLDTGTLVLRTTERVIRMVSWIQPGVSVAAPVAGNLSATSVTVWIDGVELTVENGGLEVVSTSYTGAPVAGTGAWTLCADSAGANTLTCRVASDGWHALNYPLTSAQWTDWLATGRLPYEGAGIMQSMLNRGFEIAGSGGADAFSSWGETAMGTSTITQDTSDYSPNGGVASLKMDYPSGEFASLGQGSIFTIGKTYEIHLDAKSSTGSQSLFVGGSSSITYATVTPSTTWGTHSFSFVAITTDLLLKRSGSNGTLWVDNIVISQGDILAGLDLSAQPVCSRVAAGDVLMDSASGVALAPYHRPERMTLASQLPMSADGYLLGDQTVVPDGYSVAAIEFEDVTSSATVTVRWASSSGTVLWTGSVTAGADYRIITLSTPKAAKTTTQKVYISGLRGSAKLLLDR
jgi:hypothetical protein